MSAIALNKTVFSRVLLVLALICAAVTFGPAQSLAQDASSAASRSERTATEIQKRLEQLNQTNLITASTQDINDMRRQLERLRTDALIAQSDLQEPLSYTSAQIKSLGDPPPDGQSEPASIASQRGELTQLLERLTAADKQLSLYTVEAEQLSTKVIERQRSDFFSRVLRKSKSTFNPLMWFEGLATLPELADRSLLLFNNWRKQQSGGFWFVILAMASAFSLISALWIGWRRPPDAVTEVTDEYRRLWRAARIPLYSLFILLLARASIEIMTDMQPRPERVATAFIRATFFAVVSIAVLRGILRPSRPAMRLVNLDSGCAFKAFQLASLAVLLVAVGRVLEELAHVIFLPGEFATALNAALAIALIFIVALLLIVIRGASPNSEPGAEAAPRPFYFGWASYFFHPIWLIILFSALALVASHIALAHYLMTRVVATGVLIASLVLLHHLVDALVASALDQSSTVGKFLRKTMSVGERAISILGLILSTFADIGIVLLGLPLILVQWTLTWIDFQSWIISAFFGFKVGDVTIEPSSILLGIMVLVVGLLIARLLTMWLDRRVLSRTSMDAGIRNSVKTGANYAVILMAAGLAVTSAGLDFSNFAIVFGALGVGIGFGLQSIVNNFVSGLILLAERPIKVGDWISVTGGEGIVKRINVRSTEIETFDRCSVIIPNSNLISEPVNNWYHNDVTGRVRIPIGVAYDSDPKVVEEILLNCAYGTDRVVAFPEPFVVFMNFGANSLDFELRAYIDDVGWVTIVSSDLRFKIFTALKEAGIEIPFPQQDIYIKTLPDDEGAKRAVRAVTSKVRKRS